MRSDTTILNPIGNTPLVELRNVVPEGYARIVIKLESQNPTGSMKDRMALASFPPSGPMVLLMKSFQFRQMMQKR